MAAGTGRGCLQENGKRDETAETDFRQTRRRAKVTESKIRGREEKLFGSSDQSPESFG